MARPEKNTVEYFPFLCDEGKKMFYIEETYGNDGFATFIKILRELAKTDFHYLDLSKPITLMFLSAKCKISKETLESIINDLVNLEKFDKVLWSENKIIWCQDFINSIQDAYNKRNNKCMSYDGLLRHLHSLGIRKLHKSHTKGSINTQTILEETILEETKPEKEKPFNFRKSLIEYGFKENLVDDWLKVRKNKKATNSETALNGFLKQVELKKLDKNFILEKCVERSWGGFNSDWILTPKKNNTDQHSTAIDNLNKALKYE